MAESGSAMRRITHITAGTLLLCSLALPAHAAGVRGFSTGVAGAGGSWSGSSVISHGSAGFSIYNGPNVTRVIGAPPQRTSVPLPDGRNARLAGDGHGGVHLLGAPGNHWNPGPNTNPLPSLQRSAGDAR